jgi:hypothetical protein
MRVGWVERRETHRRAMLDLAYKVIWWVSPGSTHHATKRTKMMAFDNFDPPLWRAYSGRLLLLGVVGVAGLTAMACLPPLPQSLAYHCFADDRTFLGVPNLLNVVSNLPFLFVGAWGLWFCLRQRNAFVEPTEPWPFVLFFLGVGLTAFGSSYYHLHPDNERLVWDRLPMSISFMALVAAVIQERLDPRWGFRLLLPLVFLGLCSVLYWHFTERMGRGDLRPYYFVQFYPMLALPMLLLLFPPRYTRTADWFAALGWYVLAKILEHPGDHFLYDLGHCISGHTLKHLAAAASAYWILRLLRQRRPIPRITTMRVQQ